LFFKKEAKSDFSGEKSYIIRPIREDLPEGNGKIYPGYEASKIQYTWESLFWNWRRVREYCKDPEALYNNPHNSQYQQKEEVGQEEKELLLTLT